MVKWSNLFQYKRALTASTYTGTPQTQGRFTKFVENYVSIYYYRTFTRPGATIPLALGCVKYRAANKGYPKVPNVLIVS